MTLFGIFKSQLFKALSIILYIQPCFYGNSKIILKEFLFLCYKSFNLRADHFLKQDFLLEKKLFLSKFRPLSQGRLSGFKNRQSISIPVPTGCPPGTGSNYSMHDPGLYRRDLWQRFDFKSQLL